MSVDISNIRYANLMVVAAAYEQNGLDDRRRDVVDVALLGVVWIASCPGSYCRAAAEILCRIVPDIVCS